MAIDQVVSALLAIVLVSVLLMAVSAFGLVPRDASCSLHQNFIRYIPVPAWAKPGLPDYCLPKGLQLETITDEKINGTDMARILLDCWFKTGNVERGQDGQCVEFVRVSLPTEAEVTGELKRMDVCDVFGNRFDRGGRETGCGTVDNLDWRVDRGEVTIIVKYAALGKWLEVF